MTPNPTITREEFVASKSPVGNIIWEEVQSEKLVPEDVARKDIHEFAGWCIYHEKDGKFWPHAWWYAPVSYDTAEEAIEVLWQWYSEFM